MGRLPGSSGSTGSASPAAHGHVSPRQAAGPKAGCTGLQGTARAKAGSPSAVRPHAAPGWALPDTHEPPGLPASRKRAQQCRGAAQRCQALPHSQAAGKGAGTGWEQSPGCDGWRKGAKSISVKKSGATSTGTEDAQLAVPC